MRLLIELLVRYGLLCFHYLLLGRKNLSIHTLVSNAPILIIIAGQYLPFICKTILCMENLIHYILIFLPIYPKAKATAKDSKRHR